MKQTFIFVALHIFAIVVIGCKTNEISYNIHESSDREIKIQTQLDLLNGGDKSEIDKLENPSEFIGYMGNGETASLLFDCKNELEKFGVGVRWDREKMCYEIDNTKNDDSNENEPSNRNAKKTNS